MTKYALMLAAAGFLIATPTIVKAEPHAEDTHAAHETHGEAEKHVTLEDGTKVSVEGDSVFVVAADGTKTPAPDGEHKDTDGHVWKVHGGKLEK